MTAGRIAHGHRGRGPNIDGHTALARLTEALPPMSLPQVLEHAELQTRVDRKYLVPADVCAELLPHLRREYAALEIDGRRGFRYSSSYFDTPDLLTFRQHRQGRRKRFKVRTRTYLDSGECMFEVKLTGARNATDKRRTPHDIDRREELDGDAHAFLADVLLSAYRTNPPDTIVPSATTEYLRSTLVQLAGTGRATFDTGLTCTRAGTAVAADPGMVLIESKSERGDAPVDRILRAFRVHPVKISKYCAAVAVLYPHMRANPWMPALRTYFDLNARWRPPSDPRPERTTTSPRTAPPATLGAESSRFHHPRGSGGIGYSCDYMGIPPSG